MLPFTLLFLFMLALSVGVEAWLARRQLHHVLAHRDAVPEAFRERVPLDDHRKAADYTAARVRLGFVHLAIGTLVVLAWTLGGGMPPGVISPGRGCWPVPACWSVRC